MSNLNRRTFLKLLGQGTAVLGMGLSGRAMGKSGKAWAQRGSTGFRNVKYQTFQPGEHFSWERRMIEERMDQVKNPDQIGGGASPGLGDGPSAVEEADLLAYNARWDYYNPLFNDKEYAQKAGFPGVPAFPLYVTPGLYAGPTPIPRDISDKWYYANDGGDVRVWTRVFAGDLFTTEIEQGIFEELTVPGSDLRHFKLGASAKMYNAKGEQVGWGTNNTREAYKKIIDGSPRPTFSETQEEWPQYFPEGHYTTDEEWEYIRELWKNEYIRGSSKLYWEDVKIGDEPTWVTTGPISYMDMIGCHPRSNKGYVMRDDDNWANRHCQYRDRFGQYLETDLASTHFGSRNIIGHRSVMFNNTAAAHIVRLVTNYIGDAGLVTRVHWKFKQFFKEMQVEEYQGGEFFDKVPYMKGKTCTVHPSEGDTIIAKGYVTDKYINDRGEYTIDIVCWGETLDDRIIEVVLCSAWLPSKKG